jgi:serine/threonine protein kinase
MAQGYREISAMTRLYSNLLRVALSAQWVEPEENSIRKNGDYVEQECFACKGRGYFSSEDGIFTTCKHHFDRKVILEHRYMLGPMNGEGHFSRSFWAYDMLYSDTFSFQTDTKKSSDHIAERLDIEKFMDFQRNRTKGAGLNGLVSIKITHGNFAYMALRESNIIKHLHGADFVNSLGIVNLLDVFLLSPNFVCQVFEPLVDLQISNSMSAPPKDLFLDTELLNQRGLLNKMAHISWRLFKSLEFIHSHGFIHADIKTENIMARLPTNSPKLYGVSLADLCIIDFGNALTAKDLLIHDYTVDTIQSLRYRAPEVLLGRADLIGSSMDLWSMGCILYEYVYLLFTGYLKQLFISAIDVNTLWISIISLHGTLPMYLLENAKCQIEYMNALEVVLQQTSHSDTRSYRPVEPYHPLKLRSNLSTLLRISDIHFIDLLSRLLDPSPTSRISVKNALAHEFFKIYKP